MRKSIFFAFALSTAVEANFLAAAVRGIEPVILSVGTVFVAAGFDTQPHEGAHFLGKWTGWRTLLRDLISLSNLEGQKVVRPTEVEDIDAKNKNQINPENAELRRKYKRGKSGK